MTLRQRSRGPTQAGTGCKRTRGKDPHKSSKDARQVKMWCRAERCRAFSAQFTTAWLRGR
eukprot:956569-Rhodomonas_salina.5